MLASNTEGHILMSQILAVTAVGLDAGSKQ